MNWKDNIHKFYERYRFLTLWGSFVIGYYSGLFTLTLLVLLVYAGILKP